MKTKKLVCYNCGGRGFITATYESGQTSSICPVCGGIGTHEIQMTNADNIRAMSDEELAGFLHQVGYDNRCGMKEYDLEWLQMPAERRTRMSLDITIKERKEFRCPDCGRLVTTRDIVAEYSGGREWYNFLEPIGYYVPYEKRTEENDWYATDMVLTEEQAKQLAEFVSDNQPYNAMDVECLVARALLRGNRVVINADW